MEKDGDNVLASVSLTSYACGVSGRFGLAVAGRPVMVGTADAGSIALGLGE